MYGWIWRHLPFGLPGKIVGSLLLVTGVAALLWYQIFPAVEPLLPFVDGQVTQDDGSQPSGTPEPSAPAADSTDVATPPPDVIPYSTTSNNTAPRTSPRSSPRPTTRSSR
jgi:hypothetical protein